MKKREAVILAPVMPVWDEGQFCASLVTLLAEKGYSVNVIDTLTLIQDASPERAVEALCQALNARFQPPYLLVGFAMAGTLVQLMAPHLNGLSGVISVITGFSAAELRALGEYDWLYVEQCALTLYLGYQTPQDMYDVLTQVNNVVYSSDLGQPGQPDIGEWLEDSLRWFQAAGLSAERIDTVTRLNPLRMLDPVQSPD